MRRFFKAVGARIDDYADGDLQTVRGLVTVLVTLNVIAVALCIALSAILWTQSREQDHRLKQIAVDGCEASVKPPSGVRFIVADNLEKQLARGKPLLPLLLPTATEQQRQKILKESEDQTQAQVSHLLDVDCSSGRAIPKKPDDR